MCPACYQDGGSLLHCLSTLTSASEAVYFCCTGLGVTSTGRYPASCPAKPGLSSSEPFRLFSRDYLAWLRKCYSSTFFCTCKEISFITVHTPLSREVFWHEYANNPSIPLSSSIFLLLLYVYWVFLLTFSLKFFIILFILV